MIKYMKYILIHADTFEHLAQKLTKVFRQHGKYCSYATAKKVAEKYTTITGNGIRAKQRGYTREMKFILHTSIDTLIADLRHEIAQQKVVLLNA
nr:MAG TPA: hypothetical protein [Caudoviricetes sp.]